MPRWQRRPPLRIRPLVDEYWIYWGIPPASLTRLSPESALQVLRGAVRSGEVDLSRLIDRDQFGPRSGPQRWGPIEAALRAGRMVVAQKRISLSNYKHDIPVDQQAPGPSKPAPESAPIADQVSLLISRCDPELLDGPLAFTYLVRGLEGRPCKLRIVSETFPGTIIHERDLAPSETTDGPHDAEWEGTVTAPGGEQGKRLSSAYSPARVEIVHDEAYRDQAPFTVSRLVHIVETEDVVFATGRELLMPDAWTEGAPPPSDQGQLRLTGLSAIAAVLRHAAFHPGEQLCVFGHTDTVGSADDNLTLSEARATNVLHVLRGEAQAWAAHCDAHFEVADYQRVLAWIARTKGWNTDPGPIDNDFGSLTRTARNDFRERMNAEYGTALELGSKQSPADWEAYFVLYDEALAELLECSAEDLARIRGELEFAEPASVGCGEQFPAEQPDTNNLASKVNRRVDFVFFSADELPAELPGEPPGQPLYGTKDYRAKYLPLAPADALFPVRLRLVDEGQVIDGEDWVIELDGELLAEGKTADGGIVKAELPRHEPKLILRVPKLGRSFRIDVAGLPSLPSLAGVQWRLVNLGYPCPVDGSVDDSTRNAIIAFQHDQDLTATGDPDAETMAALRNAHLS